MLKGYVTAVLALPAWQYVLLMHVMFSVLVWSVLDSNRARLSSTRGLMTVWVLSAVVTSAFWHLGGKTATWEDFRQDWARLVS